MLRDLYRFYLYAVFIAMLFFAASGIFQGTQTALALTALSGTAGTTSSTAVTQAIIYGLVALVVGGTLGGLHYWLIRRDMRGDPQAGNSGIRAFFLNAVALVSYSTGAGTLGGTISSLGQQYTSAANAGIAFAITALIVWAVVELERRRAQATAGAAAVFQRLHFYGTQLILLFIVTGFWLGTIGQAIDSLIYNGRGTGTAPCGGFTVCPNVNLLSEVAGLLIAILLWLGYGYISRRDTASRLRRVLHYASFGYALIFIILGLYRAVSLVVLSNLARMPAQNQISGPFAFYDVLTPLSFGVLAGTIYLLWLRGAARAHPTSNWLIVSAIAAAISGVVFWWGCGTVILNLLEQAAPTFPIDPAVWANTWGLVAAGIAYIPLDITLRLISAKTGIIAPLRGFVLALLGGGIVTGAVGGAIALYEYGTAAFGVPVSDWQYPAHAGIAAFLISAIITTIYLYTARREHLLGAAKPLVAQAPAQASVTLAEGAAASEETPAPVVPAAAHTVPEIVDALLAGSITRDEAIQQIEALPR